MTDEFKDIEEIDQVCFIFFNAINFVETQRYFVPRLDCSSVMVIKDEKGHNSDVNTVKEEEILNSFYAVLFKNENV